MGIKLENISKSFGKNIVLDKISLKINDGDFVSFLAPTDSGKTTLLRVIAGLEKPDSGKIYFDDQDVTDLTVKERNIAMVYQDFINYPSMNVYENIASPLRVSKKRLSEKEIDKKVRKTAALLSISEILNKKPEELSGGQRQRTAIARALIKDVKYIFLDEPLANLDYKLREELRTQLKETFQIKNGAVIYATADPLDALVLSSHVGYLYKGKLLQYNNVENVYNYPQYVQVAKYFSYPTINILKSELIKDNNDSFLKITKKLKLNVSKIINKLNKKKYLLGIRPQDLSLKKKSENDLSIQGEIELCEIVGSDTELHINCRDMSLVILIQTITDYKIGDIIKIYFDSNKFFIFDQGTKELVAKTGGNY